MIKQFFYRIRSHWIVLPLFVFGFTAVVSTAGLSSRADRLINILNILDHRLEKLADSGDFAAIEYRLAYGEDTGQAKESLTAFFEKNKKILYKVSLLDRSGKALLALTNQRGKTESRFGTLAKDLPLLLDSKNPKIEITPAFAFLERDTFFFAEQVQLLPQGAEQSSRFAGSLFARSLSRSFKNSTFILTRRVHVAGILLSLLVFEIALQLGWSWYVRRERSGFLVLKKIFGFTPPPFKAADLQYSSLGGLAAPDNFGEKQLFVLSEISKTLRMQFARPKTHVDSSAFDPDSLQFKNSAGIDQNQFKERKTALVKADAGSELLVYDFGHDNFYVDIDASADQVSPEAVKKGNEKFSNSKAQMVKTKTKKVLKYDKRFKESFLEMDDYLAKYLQPK